MSKNVSENAGTDGTLLAIEFYAEDTDRSILEDCRQGPSDPITIS